MIVLLLAFCIGPPQPLLKTHETSFVVYPADCNHMGSLFGGKIMAEMDRTAGISVRKFLYASPYETRAVTVNADVSFQKPGKLADLIYVKARIVPEDKYRNGKLIVVILEVCNEKERLALGRFTFISLDKETGRPISHGIPYGTGQD